MQDKIVGKALVIFTNIDNIEIWPINRFLIT